MDDQRIGFHVPDTNLQFVFNRLLHVPSLRPPSNPFGSLMRQTYQEPGSEAGEPGHIFSNPGTFPRNPPTKVVKCLWPYASFPSFLHWPDYEAGKSPLHW